jgi:streptomycin 6-kinase
MVTMVEFSPWLERWALTPDGEPFRTEYTFSRLLPVRSHGEPAMLKIATQPEEIRGGALMRWWDGDGAARVLAHEGPALLLERANSPDGLVAMARGGQDTQALALLCGVIDTLHRPRGSASPPELLPLSVWFEDLRRIAGQDPRLARGLTIAERLLAEPRDLVTLHGDVHHANVLDFGARGWLAIDPKGLSGERAYDYANIFRNPDLQTALAPGRLGERLHRVAQLANLDPAHLKDWTAAHAALSAAWAVENMDVRAWSFAVFEAVIAI